jgi:virulence-associated protein VagC
MVTKVFKSGNSMALRIPKELEPKEGEMSIHRKGNCWIVEPVKTKSWPKNFFEKIHIEDPSFIRHDQGAHSPVDL